MVQVIRAAVDNAAVFYYKRVLCLQRSAAGALLLRRAGYPAELVIGCRKIPFQAHAWVEVAGTVVNDNAAVTRFYTVLDRC